MDDWRVENLTKERGRRTVGGGLIALGVLLLLVSNDVLIGWGDIWPLAAIAAAAFLWRRFRRNGHPGYLFSATSLGLLGLFLLLFSLGILSWDTMAVTWPVIPLIAGAALIVTSTARRIGGPTVLAGAAMIFVAAAGILYETGAISERVASPFLRFWPLVLVVAGVVILKAHVRGPDDTVVSKPAVPEIPATATPPPPRATATPATLEADVVEKVKAAALTGDAVAALVRELKNAFPRFSWVGVYRLHAGMLNVADGDFVGAVPEYRDIGLSEGICGASAAQRRTIIVPDVCADERYLACSPTVKSEIVVPIMFGGTLIGVLDIDSDELDAFSKDDQRFLESLVTRVAPYLQAPHPAV